jgi:hypothetical protein
MYARNIRFRRFSSSLHFSSALYFVLPFADCVRERVFANPTRAYSTLQPSAPTVSSKMEQEKISRIKNIFNLKPQNRQVRPRRFWGFKIGRAKSIDF